MTFLFVQWMLDFLIPTEDIIDFLIRTVVIDFLIHTGDIDFLFRIMDVGLLIRTVNIGLSHSYSGYIIII